MMRTAVIQVSDPLRPLVEARVQRPLQREELEEVVAAAISAWKAGSGNSGRETVVVSATRMDRRMRWVVAEGAPEPREAVSLRLEFLAGVGGIWRQYHIPFPDPRFTTAAAEVAAETIGKSTLSAALAEMAVAGAGLAQMAEPVPTELRIPEEEAEAADLAEREELEDLA